MLPLRALIWSLRALCSAEACLSDSLRAQISYSRWEMMLVRVMILVACVLFQASNSSSCLLRSSIYNLCFSISLSLPAIAAMCLVISFFCSWIVISLSRMAYSSSAMALSLASTVSARMVLSFLSLATSSSRPEE